MFRRTSADPISYLKDYAESWLVKNNVKEQIQLAKEYKYDLYYKVRWPTNN